MLMGVDEGGGDTCDGDADSYSRGSDCSGDGGGYSGDRWVVVVVALLGATGARTNTDPGLKYPPQPRRTHHHPHTSRSGFAAKEFFLPRSLSAHPDRVPGTGVREGKDVVQVFLRLNAAYPADLAVCACVCGGAYTLTRGYPHAPSTPLSCLHTPIPLASTRTLPLPSP